MSAPAIRLVVLAARWRTARTRRTHRRAESVGVDIAAPCGAVFRNQMTAKIHIASVTTGRRRIRCVTALEAASKYAVARWPTLIHQLPGLKSKTVFDTDKSSSVWTYAFEIFSRDDIKASNHDYRNLPASGNQNYYQGSYLGTPSGRVYFYRAGSLPDNPSAKQIRKAMQRIK